MSSVSPSDGGYQYYARKIGDVEDEMRSEGRRARERMQEQTEELDRNYRSSLSKHDAESIETADAIRNQSADLVARERETARADVDRERAKTYDRYGKSAAEIAFHQKQAAEASVQAQEELQRRLKAEESTRPAIDEKRAIAAQEAMTASAKDLTRSHQQETAELRSTLKNLLENEKQYVKEKGQATVDVRAEIEGEAKEIEHRQERGYEDQMDKLKTDSNLALTRQNERAQDQLHDRELASANMIQKLNEEHHQSDELFHDNFQRFADQQKQLAMRSQRSHEGQLETQARVQADNQAAALTDQTQAFRKSFADQKSQDEASINHLQTELRNQRTSSDGTSVSPLVENHLRETYTQDYDKKLQQDIKRSQEKTDSLQTTYGKRVNDTVLEKQNAITKLTSQHALENQQTRTAFLDHITDMEQGQKQAKDRTEYEATHQLESMTRTHTVSQEKQRQEYEDLIDRTRQDAQLHLTAVQQKADFDAKMAQRTFSQQVNGIIRDYEKKMGDQKVQADDQIDSLKSQLAQTTRENDRRTKQLLDEQSRGNDQRLQQMEFQSKERERIISENYQDQLEKMKRTHALLAQKKS